MTKPYPMELRERAVRFVEAGESRIRCTMQVWTTVCGNTAVMT